MHVGGIIYVNRNASKEEFVKGEFVVKCSANYTFNQVNPDHAHEWLNGTAKRPGGVVRILEQFRR
jgi:hypothetical protein